MIAGNIRKQTSNRYLVVALGGAALLALGAIGGALATGGTAPQASMTYQTLPASVTSDHLTKTGPR